MTLNIMVSGREGEEVIQSGGSSYATAHALVEIKAWTMLDVKSGIRSSMARDCSTHCTKDG